MRALTLHQRCSAAVLSTLLPLALLGWMLPVWCLQTSLLRDQAGQNAAVAAELASAWNPLQADVQGLLAAAEARWSEGREELILLHDPAGRLLLKLARPGGSPVVPDWFAQSWPTTAEPARVLIGSPGLQLQVQASRAGRDVLLWRIAAQAAVGLGLAGLLIGALGLAAARWSLHPWATVIGQLQALQALRAAAALQLGNEVPEIGTLARNLNATVDGLRADLARQAEQVAALQQQAQTDSMTGLLLRHHFLDQMQQRLARAQGGQVALLLVRVSRLTELNLRLGHRQTDGLLQAVAQVLLTYVDRVPSAVAGRLNGSDFALCLPVGGMALETAESLRDTLAALPAMRASGAGAVVGGVDALPSVRSSAALAQADAALARAEAGEGEGVAVEHHGHLVADAAGAGAWRIQIADALAQGRATLDESLVGGADGRVLHRACSLRLQLDEGGAFQPGRAWLALARRGQLLPQVELLTLHLALLASAKDANPRAVRVAAESLLVPGFVTEVQALLQTAAPSVRYLAVEIAETERLGDLRALVVAVTAWRSHGVRLGVAHALASPLALPALQSMGIRFVTVGAQHLRGVAQDPALRSYAEGLFGLIRSLGLTALTDRVPAAADQELLWTLGLDGAVLDPVPTRSDALPLPAAQPTSPACSV